jgi:hypothetical protein
MYVCMYVCIMFLSTNSHYACIMFLSTNSHYVCIMFLSTNSHYTRQIQTPVCRNAVTVTVFSITYELNL